MEYSHVEYTISSKTKIKNDIPSFSDWKISLFYEHELYQCLNMLYKLKTIVMPFVGLHIGHRDDINTLLNLIVVKGLRFVHMVDANIIIKYNQISNDIKMTQSSGHRGWLEKKLVWH